MGWNTNLNDYNIILGSKSPRRKELLKKLGLKFTVQPIKVKENFEDFKKIEIAAESMSILKSNSFKNLKKRDLLICADTLVAIKKSILGKPKSKNEAKKMLNQLSGKKHKVTTGVTIKSKLNQKSFSQ